MLIGTVTKITGTLSLLILSLSGVHSQDINTGPVRLMFYNVENLFDTSDNPVTEDDEFLPGGLRRWNSVRYKTKINSLYKTIISAGEWVPPAVIGLCEIENRNVLEDLIYSTSLARYEYEIIHEDSPDPRGIDVCLVYRKDVLTLLEGRYFIPEDSGNVSVKTRSVLYAKFRLLNDTLHLFVNHWPSRRGGVLSGEELRKRIAAMLKAKADSIASSEGPDVSIVFAGDFNTGPEDEMFTSLTGNYESGFKMVNLSAGLAGMTGTYKYKGTWEMIDQVLVSEGLSKGEGNLMISDGSLKIFKPDFLLIDDPNYPGKTPFSTYNGFRYQGGYSDHLPVLLDLSVKRAF